MGNFSLKTYSVCFSVPLYDLNDKSGTAELSQGISAKYAPWFDILNLDLSLVEMPDQNPGLLFTIVARIDHSLDEEDNLVEHWNLMTSQIKEELIKFLKSRNQIFSVIE